VIIAGRAVSSVSSGNQFANFPLWHSGTVRCIRRHVPWHAGAQVDKNQASNDENSQLHCDFNL